MANRLLAPALFYAGVTTLATLFVLWEVDHGRKPAYAPLVSPPLGGLLATWVWFRVLPALDRTDGPLDRAVTRLVRAATGWPPEGRP
ncbi:MAG: hypothetical protein K2X87_00055 [Gemmataceae bacterium]|nr:hypothetical protein [Gemmataceae bacterium]